MALRPPPGRRLGLDAEDDDVGGLLDAHGRLDQLDEGGLVAQHKVGGRGGGEPEGKYLIN